MPSFDSIDGAPKVELTSSEKAASSSAVRKGLGLTTVQVGRTKCCVACTPSVFRIDPWAQRVRVIDSGSAVKVCKAGFSYTAV